MKKARRFWGITWIEVSTGYLNPFVKEGLADAIALEGGLARTTFELYLRPADAKKLVEDRGWVPGLGVDEDKQIPIEIYYDSDTCLLTVRHPGSDELQESYALADCGIDLQIAIQEVLP